MRFSRSISHDVIACKFSQIVISGNNNGEDLSDILRNVVLVKNVPGGKKFFSVIYRLNESSFVAKERNSFGILSRFCAVLRPNRVSWDGDSNICCSEGNLIPTLSNVVANNSELNWDASSLLG